MATQNFEDIVYMSTVATASIAAYKATRKEQDRRTSLQNAMGLVRALEKPADAIYKLFLLPTVLMVIKTAADLGIFHVLSQTSTFVTCQQLALQNGADIHLIERIMRVLVCNGFASEQSAGNYGPTPWACQMTERTTIGTMDSLFIDFLPIIHKTPEFLRSTNYENPGDPNKGPLQYAYKTSGTCWDWLGENPPALDRFNTFMEGSRADIAHWADWFPVQEQILDGAIANRPLLVDVGGGRGHDLAGFKDRFPSATGKLVLEDLPSVIEDIQQLDENIEKVKHDFFEPQPIKGARAYYFKHIMHDWSDDNCRVILGHITAAMEVGYSKLLIEEHIVPDQNAGSQETLLDMIVMVWCPGNERTRQRWRDLLQSAGLVITNFWLPEGQSKGIIQAQLQGTSELSAYNVTANETQAAIYNHINGSSDDILDRFCVSELCKGWPVYRDASEWNNYRDLFVENGGYVWTTWSGCLSVDEFIRVSKEGRRRGDFIMHRENSTLVDLNPSKQRAIGKMKATITQRFKIQDCTVDVECDCRFIFFCRKTRSSTGGLEWKTQYVKLFYEKDKMIPVDGHSVPVFKNEELGRYPEGYRYLGIAQSLLGHRVLQGLPTLQNSAFFDMYDAMETWLQGNDVGHALGVP